MNLDILDIARPSSAYFQSLDQFQVDLYQLLSRHYRNDTFCKLLSLKLSNFFASEYEYQNRLVELSSSPVQLMIDPSNSCQLRCPGCVHSGNQKIPQIFDWPKKLLPIDQYQDFLDQFGIHASAAILYNYGEPLLHKKFSEMVRYAKKYHLFTMTSTNLSLKIDADSIVKSGLDVLLLSIDGSCQETYEKYRRKGEFATVINNIKSLVSAKKRYGLSKPHLIWSYLTFEHNVNEVDDAIDMAKELGMDEIIISTPFDVSWDDPEIKITTSNKEGRVVFNHTGIQNSFSDEIDAASNHSEKINQAFKVSWNDNVTSPPINENSVDTNTCKWLYHNLTLDASGRVMPCCAAPTVKKSDKNLVYAQFNTSSKHNAVVNSEGAKLSRLSFSDTLAFQKTSETMDKDDLPYCSKCSEKPTPPYSFNLESYTHALDKDNIIPQQIYDALDACELYKH
ncbi:MAG TPA: hypothetical protein EYQ43_11120 [Methyloprofundus sp.]|nr:hypothetical protein [Methyloprofundus sp.]HIM07042.1 hypothetical protein [Gammaproteobacteria bacterium]